MSLIDLENKGLPDDEIETIAQKIFDLFVEAGLKLNITACEIILNRICRQPGNVKMRPNFAGRKRPACHFYSLGKCIEENASPTLGMIYEQLMRQLLRYDLETRNSTSFIDSFFEEEISMEPVKALQGVDED
jgi:recombinational DNA repair protein (RecF pathway)